MKKTIEDILADKSFQSCTTLKDIPAVPGIFVLTDCQLIESKLECSDIIEAGESATNMQEKITAIVTANNFSLKYETMTYFTWTEKQTYQRQAVLQDIQQARKQDNKKQ